MKVLTIVNIGIFIYLFTYRSAFNILTGKPTEKRLLGRPRRRWEDNIRMDLEEIGINARNWVDFLRRGIIGEHL